MIVTHACYICTYVEYFSMLWLLHSLRSIYQVRQSRLMLEWWSRLIRSEPVLAYHWRDSSPFPVFGRSWQQCVPSCFDGKDCSINATHYLILQQIFLAARVRWMDFKCCVHLLYQSNPMAGFHRYRLTQYGMLTLPVVSCYCLHLISHSIKGGWWNWSLAVQ